MSPAVFLLTFLAPAWSLQEPGTPTCKPGDRSVEAYESLTDSQQIDFVESYLAELEVPFGKLESTLREATANTPFRVDGRLKSLASFREKLERKDYGCFSQITDAVGMRIIVPDYAALPYLMGAIERRFEVVEKQYRLDRVERPGYRTLHYLVTVDGRIAELQVLTRRGAVWADAAQSLYFSGSQRNDTTLREYFWELSRAIYLRDSGIPANLPPVPVNLHTVVRAELERVVEEVASLESPKSPPPPLDRTDGLSGGADHYALDDFGALRYAWQRAISSPRCVIGSRNGTGNAYLDIVTGYRRGDVSGAIERMRALHPSDVVDAISVIGREKPPLSERCLHAAAMVHTEAAIAEKRALSWMTAEDHLEAARKLVDMFPSIETRESFRRDWLLALGWLHQTMIVNVGAIYGFAQAQEYFGEALQRFPDDGEILLSTGTLFEWAGSLRLGLDSHLEEAEALYARTLVVMPDSIEAQLRYGTVLERRGKYDEAHAHLIRALELPAGDVTLYRIHMTLGSLAQRAHRLRDAREHYEQAIAMRPTWQVARLALGHCLHQMGSRTQSRQTLEQMFSLPKAQDDSAEWWRYELGLSPRLEPHIERMRQDVGF